MNDRERRLGVTEARKDLARIIDEVRYKGERFIILRHGQPIAAIVPIGVWRYAQQERNDLIGAVQDLQTATVDNELDQIMKDVLEAQQAVRRSTTE